MTPAADPEVERVARILSGGENDDLDSDSDEIMSDGEPRWRAFVDRAVGAIWSNRLLTER